MYIFYFTFILVIYVGIFAALRPFQFAAECPFVVAFSALVTRTNCSLLEGNAINCIYAQLIAPFN